MRKNVWILLVAGVLAAGGLFVAGCGGDDDTSTTVSVEDTDAATVTEGTDTSVTATDSTSTDTTETTDSDDIDTSAFLDECTSKAEGTAAESAATTVCQQAADALEKCAQQADGNQSIVDACQAVADKAVEQLQSAG
jgi:hypothetical protein